MTNNSAEIRRLKKRIEELSVAKETEYVGWEFEGGEVVPNKENCRLQIFFDEKPDEEKRSALKMRGFHWSPTEGAWQRQLNSNAIYATDRLEFLKPLDGHRPSELQPKVNVRSILPSLEASLTNIYSTSSKVWDIKDSTHLLMNCFTLYNSQKKTKSRF